MSAPVPVRERRTWDVVLTILFLVLYLGSVVIASILSFFLAFAGDGCGASMNCDYDRIGQGMLVVLVGPWIPVLFVLGAAIILLVKRRLAFWVPLAGIALTIVIVVIGFAVSASGTTPM